MTARFDVAIVGAGCAGRSLAWHLLDAGFDGRRMVLVDPRARFDRDRTWCFFEVWPHAFEALVSHRWSRWRVRADGPWVERTAPPLWYAHLPADAFYAATTERLERAGVELRLGVAAGAVDDGAAAARVETGAGPIDAAVVFDSRPPLGRPSGEVTLVQHFEGWEVEVEQDRFPRDVATLMDFAVPQDHGVAFTYVLPFDRRRALVEATWFSSSVPEPAVHHAALERALEGSCYHIRRRERGVIPMTTASFPRRVGRRVYPIGLAGGLAKPSTGYAFVDIQRYAVAMARRLRETRLPDPPPLRPAMSRFQDQVFLSYLDRHPSEATRALVGLFERLPAELVPRFLHDRVTAAERLRVMSAMPLRRMTSAVVRSAPIWLRG